MARQSTAPAAAELIVVGGRHVEPRSVRSFLDGAFQRMKAAQGEIVAALGEVERGQDYRDEGATSVEAWVVQRYGRLGGECPGVGTGGQEWPGTSRTWWVRCAPGRSLWTSSAWWPRWRRPRPTASGATRPRSARSRDLAEMARTRARADAVAAEAARRDSSPSPSRSQSEHDRRYLRFNDEHRTLTRPVAARLLRRGQGHARGPGQRASNRRGTTPWDQRLCDGFLDVIGSQRRGCGQRGRRGQPVLRGRPRAAHLLGRRVRSSPAPRR